MATVAAQEASVEETHSFVVLLGLQGLSDVGDGLDGRLELVGQCQVAAGPVDVLPHVRGHTLRLVPATDIVSIPSKHQSEVKAAL